VLLDQTHPIMLLSLVAGAMADNFDRRQVMLAARELWLESLGLQAVLPPPEEQKHVKTAIGAAQAQQESERTR